MKPALVDTDTLSMFFRGDPCTVTRFQAYLDEYAEIKLSIVTYYEIVSGLRHRDAAKQLDAFLEFARRNAVLPIGRCPAPSPSLPHWTRRGRGEGCTLQGVLTAQWKGCLSQVEIPSGWDTIAVILKIPGHATAQKVAEFMLSVLRSPSINTILVSQSVGIDVTGGSTVTVNSILWFDTPITVSQAVTATVTAQNEHWGDLAFAADGYHITPASAAIDAGVDAGVTTDIDGHYRPFLPAARPAQLVKASTCRVTEHATGEVSMPLVHRRIIQGEPIRVGQREVVPEAQVTWWLKRSATVGTDSSGGWGAGLVNIKPTALIERGPGYSRRIPIRDETLRLLVGLAAGAVFVLFLAQMAERLATSKGGSK